MRLRTEVIAMKTARIASRAPAIRAAYFSVNSGLELERKRQETTAAERSSIVLSPPNPSRAGLRALHAAARETTASTIIQAIVNLWSCRMRRDREGACDGSAEIISAGPTVPETLSGERFGHEDVVARNLDGDVGSEWSGAGLEVAEVAIKSGERSASADNAEVDSDATGLAEKILGRIH